MGKHRFKKLLSIIMAFVMILSLSSSIMAEETKKQDTSIDTEETSPVDEVSSSDDPTPFVSTWVDMYSDIDGTTGVDGGNPVEITVEWVESSTRPEPVTISVANEAKILAVTESDIKFITNGNEKEITELSVNENRNQMTFIATPDRAARKCTVTFLVESPITSRQFGVDAQIGSGEKGKVNKSYTIISGLTVETSAEKVDDVDPFFITGLACYKGQKPPEPSYVIIEIYNKATNELVEEFVEVGDIVGKEYNVGPILMPSHYEDGMYIVKAILMQADNWLGAVTKEIEFVKKPDLFSVSIYNQVKNIRFTREYPKPNEGVLYDYLTVLSNFVIAADCDIQANAIFKNSYAAEIKSSKFVVTTNFGNYEFAGIKSGGTITGNLRTFRTGVYVSGSQRPYVNLYITKKDGTTEKIFIGEIRVAVDPSGIIYDGETMKPLSGSICSLYMLDEENGDWILWVDETGQQQNPVVTGVDGKYAWDVQDGKYEVRAYHPDYFESEDLYYSTLLDERYGILEVPPEQTNINIELFKQSGGETPAQRAVKLDESLFIPAHQEEIDLAIANHTSAVINVDGADTVLYLTKNQVERILNSGLDLIVVQNGVQKTVDRSLMKEKVKDIRKSVVFVIKDL